MSTLTSDSTLAEIKAAFEDNCTYDLEDSPTMAAEFIRAARMLARRAAGEMQQGSSRIREDERKYEREADKATRWLEARRRANAGSSYRYHSFDEDFRG